GVKKKSSSEDERAPERIEAGIGGFMACVSANGIGKDAKNNPKDAGGWLFAGSSLPEGKRPAVSRRSSPETKTDPPTREAAKSIAIQLGLVGALDGHADVVRLLVGQLGQLRADLVEVEAGDFLVELLGQDVDAGLVDVLVLPEVDLGEGL